MKTTTFNNGVTISITGNYRNTKRKTYALVVKRNGKVLHARNMPLKKIKRFIKIFGNVANNKV